MSAKNLVGPVFDPALSAVLQAALDKAASMQEADGVSASFYISDRCHWEGVSGTTTQDPTIQVETDMLFGFGSITKTFIAAIVLQLVEENKLALEDTLGKWLEDYPNIDPNTTVRQLLNHSSGIGNYTDSEALWPRIEEEPNRVWLPKEVLRYVGPPTAPAGEGWQYSNTNYILLGMVIERATGNTVEQELEDRITGPLLLRSTHLFKENFEPYRWGNTETLSTSRYSSAWTAGAVAATARDIAKWAHTLFSGSFLKSVSLDKMLTVEIRGIEQSLMAMGMGVWEFATDGEVSWGHGGWIDDYVSKMFYLPRLELGVAYSSSRADASTQSFPGDILVRAYIDNRPKDISVCFDSPDE